MSGHTPGPWRVSPRINMPDERQGGQHRIFAGDDQVAQTNYDTLYRQSDEATFTTSEADARLIAAAPDLLEALREILAAGESYVDSADEVKAMLRFGRATDAARAAIAKAEGR